MNNSVFGKAMENVAKQRNIKLVTTDKRRDYLASEPNYHTSKFFKEDLFAIEMKKSQIFMDKLHSLCKNRRNLLRLSKRC